MFYSLKWLKSQHRLDICLFIVNKKDIYQAYVDFLAILDYKTPIRARSLC